MVFEWQDTRRILKHKLFSNMKRFYRFIYGRYTEEKYTLYIKQDLILKFIFPWWWPLSWFLWNVFSLVRILIFINRAIKYKLKNHLDRQEMHPPLHTIGTRDHLISMQTSRRYANEQSVGHGGNDRQIGPRSDWSMSVFRRPVATVCFWRVFWTDIMYKNAFLKANLFCLIWKPMYLARLIFQVGIDVIMVTISILKLC